MAYMTYNISQHAIQAKHRPLTPNRSDTVVILATHVPLYLRSQYPIYLNRSKVTCEDEMYAVNQKLLDSLTDKWYISLTIYLMKHFKPNIDL